MAREILVGVDGSDSGMNAVAWAAEAARRRGVALRVVCSYSVPSFSTGSVDGGYLAMDEGALRRGAEAVVEAAAEAAGPEVDVRAEVRAGDPTAVLAELSREVDLVVIGRRKGGSWTARLLGAVSSSLPAHAHCPTVVVPLDPDRGPVTPIKRIVVGVDGSAQAARALELAMSEASFHGAELDAVSGVAFAPGGSAFGWAPIAMDVDKLLQDVEAGLGTAVADAKEATGLDVPVQYHALGGNAAALLTEFSSVVDLVVLGTRGRGGFAGMLLGSTSQTVIQHSQCPVMVVHDVDKQGDHSFPWMVS